MIGQKSPRACHLDDQVATPLVSAQIQVTDKHNVHMSKQTILYYPNWSDMHNCSNISRASEVSPFRADHDVTYLDRVTRTQTGCASLGHRRLKTLHAESRDTKGAPSFFSLSFWRENLPISLGNAWPCASRYPADAFLNFFGTRGLHLIFKLNPRGVLNFERNFKFSIRARTALPKLRPSLSKYDVGKRWPVQARVTAC